MIYFDAVFLDGETSTARKVKCELAHGFLTIRENSESILRQVDMKECKVEPALGDTRNVIILPDGARCETFDSRAFKAALGERGNLWDIVHAFESLWPLVIIGIAGIAAFIWAFAVIGIPMIGDIIAPKIPVQILETLSEKTIDSLDEHLLSQSDLPSEKQHELIDLFERHVSGIDPENNSELDYRLVFRKSEVLGANALALPSGIIIITDGLADLYKSDQEITGIFAHEMAHAKFRHGIKSIIQNTGIFVLMSLVMGDFTAMNSSIAVLPLILAESGYSRNFEKEADLFAGQYLIREAGTNKPYREILKRLSEKSNFAEPPKYLSTHPPTEERIEFLESIENNNIKP